MTCDPDCEKRTMCNDAGKVGHFQCGSCPEHNKPRHHCGCVMVNGNNVNPIARIASTLNTERAK